MFTKDLAEFKNMLVFASAIYFLMKTKIRIYDDRVNTNFQGQNVPKENASYKCISLIMLDSVIRVNKKYYPQTLLEEC